MTFPARLTELIEKATKGPIIAYEDVQEAGKLKLFFSAIKDSNGAQYLFYRGVRFQRIALAAASRLVAA